jgi:hypothetical protein
MLVLRTLTVGVLGTSAMTFRFFMHYACNMLYVILQFFWLVGVLLAMTTRWVLAASRLFTPTTFLPGSPMRPGLHSFSGAPLPTQPTQEGTQPTESTPLARQRHPLDQLTYPTAQIRYQGA